MRRTNNPEAYLRVQVYKLCLTHNPEAVINALEMAKQDVDDGPLTMESAKEVVKELKKYLK